MSNGKDSDQATSTPAEGVRIIGAEEAQAALDLQGAEREERHRDVGYPDEGPSWSATSAGEVPEGATPLPGEPGEPSGEVPPLPHWTEPPTGVVPAILAALAREPDYLGVVASSKRFGEMRRLLAGRAPEAALARIKNPAGLDLGAQLPEEIAVSILAEIVQTRPRSKPPAETGPSPEAIDPVCGMTVRSAGAAHRAQHGGQDYFFCCAGCRERFLASPERYL